MLWASWTDEEVAEEKHGYIYKGDGALWFVCMGYSTIGDSRRAYFRSTSAAANPWDAAWERNDGNIGAEPNWVPDSLESPVEMAARAFKKIKPKKTDEMDSPTPPPPAQHLRLLAAHHRAIGAC